MAAITGGERLAAKAGVQTTLLRIVDALEMGGVSSSRLAEMLGYRVSDLHSYGLQAVANATHEATTERKVWKARALAAEAALRKPEREVVGWVVRTSSEYEPYARDVAGDTFGWNSTATRPVPVSRQDAIGLLNRCRLWAESGGARWTFRLVRITRRKKAEVG